MQNACNRRYRFLEKTEIQIKTKGDLKIMKVETRNTKAKYLIKFYLEYNLNFISSTLMNIIISVLKK